MSAPLLTVRLLGPLAVSRQGADVPLPPSRKVRGLLAFLALAPAPLSRSRLCDLFWDIPNDPRGELRWCLSKLRGLLDDAERRRVISSGDSVRLDLSDCHVDALEVERVRREGLSQATLEHLSQISELFGGELLEGLELEGSELTGWLAAHRHGYRALHVSVLRELLSRSGLDASRAFQLVERWLQVAPFDTCAHEALLQALVSSGRNRDAEAHVAAALRSFEAEGVDAAALREAWRAMRAPSERPRAISEASPLAGSPLIVGTPPAEPARSRRASVAIMPFTIRSGEALELPGVADGLTDDIITRLAKLRVLFVIARGTVYALSERGLGAQEAGRLLNVEYVVSGSVRRRGAQLSVMVELAATADARIIWADELGGAASDAFTMLDSIVDRVVAAIAEEIEAAECQRARLAPPTSLDAWQAYHRGLWHMYRFNAPDNRDAAQFFRRALELDPTFSRAHAGLSFTHFQNAFLGLTADRERQIDLAVQTASESLSADERDPAAHWALGRALWLRGEQRESCAELSRSVELSPNFALGHYTLGFVLSQSGDPRAAIAATNLSRQLSPYDPLQFGMLASRALAHLRLGEPGEAASWALEAVTRPNAHVHILAIAIECLSLAGRVDEARSFVARLRQRAPGYGVADLLRAFRFDRDTEQLLRRGARAIGFE